MSTSQLYPMFGIQQVQYFRTDFLTAASCCTPRFIPTLSDVLFAAAVG